MTEDGIDWAAMVITRQDVSPWTTTLPELLTVVANSSLETYHPLLASLSSATIVVEDYLEENFCDADLGWTEISYLAVVGLSGVSLLLSIFASYFIWRARRPTMEKKSRTCVSPSEIAKMTVGLQDSFQVCVQNNSCMLKYFHRSRCLLRQSELLFVFFSPSEQELVLRSLAHFCELIASYSGYWQEKSRCSRLTPHDRLSYLDIYEDALTFIDQIEDCLHRLREREMEVLKAKVSMNLAESIARHDVEEMLRLTAECEVLELKDAPVYRQSMALIEKEANSDLVNVSSNAQVAVVPFLPTEALPADPSALMLVSHVLHLLDLRERKLAAERDVIERRRSIEDSRRRAREAAVGRLAQLQLLAGLREGARSGRRVVSLMQRDRLRLERRALEKAAKVRLRYLRLAHVIVGAAFAAAVLLQRLYLKASAVTLSDVQSLICNLQPSDTPIGAIVRAINDWILTKHTYQIFESMAAMVQYQRYLDFQFVQNLYCGMNLLQSLIYFIISQSVVRLFDFSFPISMALSLLIVTPVPWQSFTIIDGVGLAMFSLHISTWLYALVFIERFSKSRSVFDLLASYYAYPLTLVLYFYTGPSFERYINEVLFSWWNSSTTVIDVLNTLMALISAISMA